MPGSYSGQYSHPAKSAVCTSYDRPVRAIAPKTDVPVVLSCSMEKSMLRVGGRSIALSNLDKILYPGGRVTKAQVIEYYSKVAPVLLPHFKNRPVTLVRYPDGVYKESFYEKN